MRLSHARPQQWQLFFVLLGEQPIYVNINLRVGIEIRFDSRNMSLMLILSFID